MTAFIVTSILAKNRLHISLAGFASPRDIDEFRQSLARALSELATARTDWQLLYDVSLAVIQSQETLAALRDIVIKTPKAEAIALVYASALAGRQLNRIFAGITPKLFSSVEDAENWLDSL